MKTIVETNDNEGLKALLGRRILLMCAGYFYEGKLVGIDEHDIKLMDAHIVYSTGDFKGKEYNNSQKLHTDVWYVRTGLIESYGLSKND